VSISPAIRSMTGHGAARFQVGQSSFLLEARSVNSRHADLKLRLPWMVPGIEAELLADARTMLHRGRVDLVLTAGDGRAATEGGELATRCRDAHTTLFQLAHQLGTPTPTLSDVLNYLAREAEREGLGGRAPEGFLEAARAALKVAMQELDAMRCREGEAMAKAMRELLAEARVQVEAVADLVREQPRRAGDKLVARIQSLLAELGQNRDAMDAGRIAAEVAILAERLDVTEELVRLRSHLDQFEAILAGPAPQGRKLDFLLQELGREVNTIGSKCQDATAACRVVELKALFEKVREVVQNVE
jgi:uncharacterized protein (TIGR00255 family)